MQTPRRQGAARCVRRDAEGRSVPGAYRDRVAAFVQGARACACRRRSNAAVHGRRLREAWGHTGAARHACHQCGGRSRSRSEIEVALQVDEPARIASIARLIRIGRPI